MHNLGDPDASLEAARIAQVMLLKQMPWTTKVDARQALGTALVQPP